MIDIKRSESPSGLRFLVVQSLVGIGRLCQSDKQCPVDQFCIWGKCLCFSGQVLMENRCVQDFYCLNGQEVYHNKECYYLSAIGDECIINEQCYGESFCVNNYCACINETVNVNGLCQKRNSKPVDHCDKHQILNNGQCLNITVIGGTCQIDAQCANGAKCLKQQCLCPPETVQNEQMCIKIECPENAVLVNGRCMYRAIPGQQCNESVICLDGSQCSVITHFCVCLEGMNNIGGYCRKLSHTDPCDSMFMVYVNGSCNLLTKPGGICNYDLQCLGGSICSNGYCNCPIGTTNTSGYCIGAGKCDQSDVLVNNRCYKRVTFNETCLISQQCPSCAICNYAARCVCPVGMKVVNGECRAAMIKQCSITEVMVDGECVLRRIPGNTCIANEQCLDESRCVNGRCTCPPDTELLSGYCVRRNGGNKCNTYETYVNGKCLNLAIPGENCMHNLQCIAAATCPAGKCVCPNGYREVTKYCIRDTKPSIHCNINQVLLNDHCYELAKIGEYCIDTAVCLGDSICFNNSCTCPTDTIARNDHCYHTEQCDANEVQIEGQCFPRINIGQHCQFTQQCVSLSICHNDICICPSGTVSQNNICQSSGPCPTGQMYIEEGCWDIAHIGQYCHFMQQCQGYSACINNICRCPNDTVPRNGLCAKIDEFCYYTEQCQGKSLCKASRCTCPTGTIIFNGTCVINPKCQPYQILISGSCLDTVSIGMICQDNAQCIESASCVAALSSSNMNGRTCQCNNGTVFTGTKCLTSSIQCPPSTVYVNDKLCQSLVQIGQFCLHTIQCMGYSICSKQICKCPTGFAAIRNVCRRVNW
uniref:EGF-like domain-containing protein n=1 Tax=Setaria digitata TaxID=48799 RepID=A0A915Q447_9BILA